MGNQLIFQILCVLLLVSSFRKVKASTCNCVCTSVDGSDQPIRNELIRTGDTISGSEQRSTPGNQIDTEQRAAPGGGTPKIPEEVQHLGSRKLCVNLCNEKNQFHMKCKLRGGSDEQCDRECNQWGNAFTKCMTGRAATSPIKT